MTNNHSEPVVFDNRDISRYVTGERRMAMRGFEAEYTDIVDYGDTHGRDSVVAATLEWLAAFPERRVYADDVMSILTR